MEQSLSTDEDFQKIESQLPQLLAAVNTLEHQAHRYAEDFGSLADLSDVALLFVYAWIFQLERDSVELLWNPTGDKREERQPTCEKHLRELLVLGHRGGLSVFRRLLYRAS